LSFFFFFFFLGFLEKEIFERKNIGIFWGFGINDLVRVVNYLKYFI